MGKTVNDVTAPDTKDPGRYEGIEDYKSRFGEDRYYIASLGLSGFTIMTLLRGFTDVLTGADASGREYRSTG